MNETLLSLLHVSAHSRCHHQGVISLAIIANALKYSNLCMCQNVFYPLSEQRTIPKALDYLLKELYDNDIYDVSKHVADLLTSEVCVCACV